ncbi:tight adherence protein B [Glaciihabitans tibetensis]|uniref:Tight adherence protein B n=1 Tax=Glaciihabitans tibetensis TaxID=1266600 RepID=A0A2T0VH43_9MICO|nr:type II secretion system F family protein [Glaciihabitans tibetensis]PRY69495.1 tight adherence protein B [Glaciihabitans tibetensis]
MALTLGLLLGAGVLLVAAPLLWPHGATSRSPCRRPRWSSRAEEVLVQAGLRRVPVAVVAAVSVILGAATAAVTSAAVPVVALALAAGTAGLVAPTVVIITRARTFRRATRVVWPDVVDHLLSAVRSGLALPDSVVTLAHSGPPVTRAAFADFELSYRTTGNFSAALDRLKARLVDPVADRIIETLRMSREVGGHELPTVLRNLAVYLRQDAAIRAEVEARQSWTVNAARLGVAAPWIILVLLASRPEAASAYNSVGGSLLICGGAGLSAAAYWLMRAIGRLPEEKRWFE